MATKALHYALEERAIEYLGDRIDVPAIQYFHRESESATESPCILVSAIEQGQDVEVCGVWQVELTCELVATPEELSAEGYSEAFRQLKSAIQDTASVKAGLTGSDTHVFNVLHDHEIESELEEDTIRRSLTVTLIAAQIDDVNSTLPSVDMPARAVLNVADIALYHTDNFTAAYDPDSVPTAPGGTGVPGSPINGDFVREQRRNAVLDWKRVLGAWAIQQVIRRSEVNAEDYGLSEAGTAAANKTALDSAIAAAAAVDLPLVIPGGSFAMDPVIDFAVSVTIRGAGTSLTTVDNTTLDFTGAGDFADTAAFTFSEHDLTVVMENLDISGTIFTSAPTNEPNGFEVTMTGTDDSGEKNKLTLRNVRIRGFHNAIRSTQSGGTHGVELTLERCWIHDPYENCVKWFSDDSGAYTERVLIARDCLFDNNSFSHLFYIHPHTAFEFHSCAFDNATDYAVQIRTAAGSNAGSRHLFDACHFRSGNAKFMVANDSGSNEEQPPLTIVNSTFDVALGTLQIWSGCIFRGNQVRITETNGTLLDLGKTTYARQAIIEGNIFEIESQTSSDYLINSTAEELVCTIANNVFDYKSGATVCRTIAFGSTSGPTTANTSRLTLSGNIFKHQGTAACRFVDIQGDCIARISENIFRGRSESSRGLIVPKAMPGTDSRLDITGNTFDMEIAAGQATGIWLGCDDADGVSDGKVFASENTIIGANASIENNESSANAWQILCRRGTNPNAIASASSVLWDINYSVAATSGTTTINTINYGTVAGVNPDKCHAGSITLILPNTAQLGTSGNIANTFTASGTQAITLHWDATTSKWTA